MDVVITPFIGLTVFRIVNRIEAVISVDQAVCMPAKAKEMVGTKDFAKLPKRERCSEANLEIVKQITAEDLDVVVRVDPHCTKRNEGCEHERVKELRFSDAVLALKGKINIMDLIIICPVLAAIMNLTQGSIFERVEVISKEVSQRLRTKHRVDIFSISNNSVLIGEGAVSDYRKRTVSMIAH